MPGSAGKHPDHRELGRRGGLAVARDAADGHLDRNRADIRAAEAIHAKWIHEIGVLIRPREQRQVPTQIEGVEYRPQVDVECFGTLPGENPYPALRIRVDP